MAVVQEYLEFEVMAVRKFKMLERNGYVSFADFVLQHGRPFTWSPRPRWMKRGAPKMCFQNCGLLALEHPDLIYVEGYAWNGAMPVLHAWLTDASGRAFDPTWKRNSGADYFGIPFDSKFYRRFIYRHKFFGVIDLPQAGFPIFRIKPKTFLAN
jgi:hypothetical protein